jgi:hypothetical protein
MSERYTVTIPRFHPARLNQLLGNYHAAGRRKAADRAMIGYYCDHYQVPEAKVRRRVSLTLQLGYRMRGGDPDAYWKSVLDALVNCGRLVDDRKEWVELAPVRYERADEFGTILSLEDVSA